VEGNDLNGFTDFDIDTDSAHRWYFKKDFGIRQYTTSIGSFIRYGIHQGLWDFRVMKIYKEAIK
jgi:hypothetical protein